MLAALVAAATLLVSARADAFIQGIDVYNGQGDVNYTTVKNAGLQFVFCKATEGVDFVDLHFTKNMNGAIAAGVPIGPYHFARLNSGETLATDAVDEANDFVDAIAPFYSSSGIVLRPVLDLEELPDDPVSPSVKAYVSQWARDFCSRVQTRLGIAPIIYVNGDFAQHYLETNLNQYPLWFAKPIDTTQSADFQNNFSNAVAPTAANIGIWSSIGYKFWQWSFHGNVGGENPVDRDVFNGTLLQMVQQFSPTYSNGDYNNNGIVDDADYILWRSKLGQTVNLGTSADGDLSGIIDAGDYTIWKTNFGKAVAGAAAGAVLNTVTVPEPTAFLLAWIAACGLATRRRRV